MENFFRSILEFIEAIADTIYDIFGGIVSIIQFNFSTLQIFQTFSSTLPDEILIFGVLGFCITVVFIIVGR